MSSSASPAECFYDTPTDFDAFVARQHGVAKEQAAQLIVRWMQNYQSRSASPASAASCDRSRRL